MEYYMRIGPGILLCSAIGALAWLLGQWVPIVGGPVFAILMGMLLTAVGPGILVKSSYSSISNFSSPLDAGVKFTSKKILQYAIILLGFEMNLFNVIHVGAQSLFVMLFTLSAAFVTAYIVGKALGLEEKMTILIGVGTSICGGSAIAATAPVIQAKDEDVAHAISTIFLFNILAVFLFPPLGHVLRLSDMGFGMWAGTAINDTSSVVAAGTAWSNAAENNTALAFATIVKLTRTLMIVPITFVLAIWTARKKKDISTSSVRSYRFSSVFPWFVMGFIGTAVVNTFWGIPSLSSAMVLCGKFMIVMAMSAIGLNTDMKRLLTNGLKPISLGLCCWVAVASVSLIVQALTANW